MISTAFFVGEHDVERETSDEHSGANQDPNFRNVLDRQSGRLVVERKQIDERRYLVEQKVGRRGDSGRAALRREQFVEPVEERRGDADLSPGVHSVTGRSCSANRAAVVSTRCRKASGR